MKHSGLVCLYSTAICHCAFRLLVVPFVFCETGLVCLMLIEMSYDNNSNKVKRESSCLLYDTCFIY